MALGKACEIASHELPTEAVTLQARRDSLLAGSCPRPLHLAPYDTPRHSPLPRDSPAALERQVQGPHIVHGPHDPAHRLPTTLSISFPGVWASDVVSLLGTEVACSAGAACHAEGPPRVSHVLAAMGVEEEVAMGTLRLSVGRFTTEEEVRGPPGVPLGTGGGSQLTPHPNAGRARSKPTGRGSQRAAQHRTSGDSADAPAVPRGALPRARQHAIPLSLLTRGCRAQDSTLYFADAVVVRASEGPENGQVTLVTNATVFHPQGGGQPSDVGHVYLPSEHASLPVLLHVLKARWADGGVVEHICDIEVGGATLPGHTGRP